MRYLLLLLFSTVALAAGTTTTINSSGKVQLNLGGNIQPTLFPMAGLSGSTFYPLTANASGNLAISNSGKNLVTSVRNEYTSTSVTTSAYLTLVSALTSAVTEISIFDSSGQTLQLKLKQNGSFVYPIVFPGGNGREPIAMDSGSSVSIEAITGTANAGEIDLNFYN